MALWTMAIILAWEVLVTPIVLGRNPRDRWSRVGIRCMLLANALTALWVLVAWPIRYSAS